MASTKPTPPQQGPVIRDRAQVIKVIESTGEIPTLPIVIAKINEVIRNPRTSASDVGNLISQDQVLTAKTLRLVNSAFYGFPRKISNITRAIVILGFQKVKNLALTASVFDAFKKSSETAGWDYLGFWQHSMATAIAAEVLAKRTRTAEVEEAFVCGLIHDLGKLILVQFLKPEYQAVQGYMTQHGGLMVVAEKETLGYHHGLVGEVLAEKWQFPSNLCNVIRMHHSPGSARDARELVYIVHAADILVRSLDIGKPGDDSIPDMSPEVWHTLGLSIPTVDKVMAEIIEGYANASEFLELVKS